MKICINVRKSFNFRLILQRKMIIKIIESEPNPKPGLCSVYPDFCMLRVTFHHQHFR